MPDALIATLIMRVSHHDRLVMVVPLLLLALSVRCSRVWSCSALHGIVRPSSGNGAIFVGSGDNHVLQPQRPDLGEVGAADRDPAGARSSPVVAAVCREGAAKWPTRARVDLPLQQSGSSTSCMTPPS